MISSDRCRGSGTRAPNGATKNEEQSKSGDRVTFRDDTAHPGNEFGRRPAKSFCFNLEVMSQTKCHPPTPRLCLRRRGAHHSYCSMLVHDNGHRRALARFRACVARQSLLAKHATLCPRASPQSTPGGGVARPTMARPPESSRSRRFSRPGRKDQANEADRSRMLSSGAVSENHPASERRRKEPPLVCGGPLLGSNSSRNDVHDG
jgi:hypothetical protein